MFDIIYHKTIIVFKTPEEDTGDLIDLVVDIGATPTKEQLIERLNRILEQRRGK